MVNIKLLIFFTAGLTIATSRRHVHFYRKDYTFFEEYDTFYKLHWDLNGLSWNSAFMACDDEGAKLFYPKEEGEWSVVKNLSSSCSVAPNVTDIFVGIHDEFGLGEFMTVDGQSTPTPIPSDDQIISQGTKPCVLMDIETGAFKTDSCVTELETIRPFVCKRVDDKPCPTIDRDYIYKKESKKCYKVNNRPKVWQEALHTCFTEGGILAVVENEAQASIIYDMIIPDADNCYFTGFRRIFSDSIYYTVKGQKLGENSFQRWFDKEHEDREECGVLYRYSNRLYVKSSSCMNQLPFVCEMDART